MLLVYGAVDFAAPLDHRNAAPTGTVARGIRSVPDVDVFCVPPDDLEFERRVRYLAHLYSNATIGQVEAVLRLEFPNARLTIRGDPADAIALNDRVSWYAYRHGLDE
jgi:hypothetical protein